MIHINMRLPQYVVDYFKEFPSYTKEMRKVLEEHVNQADKEGATRVALDQQRWQDILAEENYGMEIYDKFGGVLTDPNYWDCECEKNYIHHVSDVEPCAKCNADPDEQPNSRPNEIAKVFDAFERAEHDQIARSDEEENNSE
jgi:hypothetical protein